MATVNVCVLMMITFSSSWFVESQEKFSLQVPELSVSVQLSYPISYNYLNGGNGSPFLQMDFIGAMAAQTHINWANILESEGKMK